MTQSMTPETFDSHVQRLTKLFLPFANLGTAGALLLFASCIVAWRQRSLLALLFGPLTLLLYHRTRALCLTIADVRKLVAAITGLHQLQKSFRLRVYPLASYADALTIEHVMVKARVVCATPAGEEAPPLSALMSFINPKATSVIIITDPPELVNDFQRFFIYHELGHLTRSGLFGAYYLGNIWWLRITIAYLLFACLGSGLWFHLFLLFAFLVSLFFEHSEIPIELAADHFAASRMFAAKGKHVVVDTLRRIQRNFGRSLQGKQPGSDLHLLFSLRMKTLNRMEQALDKEEFWRLQLNKPRSVAGVFVMPNKFFQLLCLFFVSMAPRVPTLIEIIAVLATLGCVVLINAELSSVSKNLRKAQSEFLDSLKTSDSN